MPDTPAIATRLARQEDLAALHAVIERAYRGDTARAGWTHESDLLADPRTDLATLAQILDASDQRLIIATDALAPTPAPIGCVQLTDRGGGLAYMGLLCIDPLRQAAGLGRQLIAEAEAMAVADFAASAIEMTVIDRRAELIAYYERRGYALTGETRPFPIPLDPPYRMVVLAKALAAPSPLG